MSAGLRRRLAAPEGRRAPGRERRWYAEEELLPEALAALGWAGELERWRGCGMARLLADDPALAGAVAAAGNARTGLGFHPEDRLA